jgi:hypothetical protein
MLGQYTPADEGTSAALLIVLIGLYLIPTIVGVIRKVPNIGSIVVINLFLGWSIIGWVVALAMAARTVPPKAVQRIPRRRDGLPPPP